MLFSIHAVAVSGQPDKSELSPHNSSTAPPCSPISSQGQTTKPAPQAQLQVSSTALAGATPAGDHNSLLISYMCNTFRSLYVSRQHVLSVLIEFEPTKLNSLPLVRIGVQHV